MKTNSTNSENTRLGLKNGLYRMLKGKWPILLLMLLSVGGCKKVTETPGSTGICPTVIATDPVNGAINVVNSKVIIATFSESMNPVTINTETFKLNQGTNKIAGEVTYSGDKASFFPAVLLAANTVYTATITTGSRDSSGNYMATDYVWSFNTGSTPTVTATNPANGASDVGLGKVVTATFSTNMNPATINANSFQLKHGANLVAGSVTYSNMMGTFTPDSPLLPNTVYTGTITTEAKDSSGNALASNYVWSFSTGSIPTVISTDPTDGASSVALNKVVAATFSKSMDANSINTSTFILKNGSTQIAGSVVYSASGNTASFTPASKLLPSTVYTGTITTGAKDSSGNALASNYSWTFTTGVSADTVRPVVITTDPTNGATNVALNKVLAATFSKFMDPSTINSLTFVLKQGTTQLLGTISYSSSSNTATFIPANALLANTLYTATITTGAKDTSGNALAANYIWTFTTAQSNAPSFLGTAAIFGAFGGNAGITNQGVNTVINNGSIGTTAASTLITGFHDGTTGDVYTETPLNIGLVTGRIYTAPPAPGTAASAAIATQGLSDARAAFDSLSPANKPGGTDPGAGELGTLTLSPGIYKSASGAFGITSGNLTLDGKGDSNAVFIFQAASSLTVGSPAVTGGPRSVILIGNAQPKNVYWYVGSGATINGAGGGTMVGTIIASAGITISTAGNATQTVLDGRVLSLNASVTMINTTINVP